MEASEVEMQRGSVQEDGGDKMDDKLQQRRSGEGRSAAMVPPCFQKSHVTSALSF